jgi:hypothetical protein
MIARPGPDLVRTEVIDEVPSDWVDRVSQDFRDSAAMDVKLERNRDGKTWRVIATFQDS